MQDIDPELNALSEAVIGAAIAVHRELGAGFAELTYRRAMEVECRIRGLGFACEVPVQLLYRNESIGDGRIDMLFEDRLVVELKATQANPQRYRRQVVAYLKSTDLKLGLVINFEVGALRDGLCRVVNSKR